MRILVVDDDKIIRMGLAKVIERITPENEVAGNFANGSLALNYLKENDGEVHLVITDIKMPVMTGVDLIKKAIEELKNPPLFVVLSGYDEFTYVRDTMKFGAFNYLLKPIKKDELKQVLGECEDKIKAVKKENKIFNKSIEVLKRDLFKNILFSNKELENANKSALLSNIQFDENYIYKMIIVDKNIDKSNDLAVTFIKKLLSLYENLQYSFFYYKDSIYMVFYIINTGESSYPKIMQSMVDETDIFLENEMNVYILSEINDIWKLRNQACLFRKVKEGILKDSKAKKYFLENEDKLLQVFNENDDPSSITVIKLAKDYIINNFNKNISLKDVADEVYLSQNYLSELFKREIGEGFYDFLSKYRIKKAKEMLLTTNLKIYEVAEKVGYNDSITFGRAFKKITGVTPNSFRNNKE